MPARQLSVALPAALSFHAVTKCYENSNAVDAVEFCLPQGRFAVLVGPSGCGKTTLLRLAAGFLAPDAGRIEIDGRDVSATPPQRRGLGFVFQSYALFPTQTVAENVGFALRLRRTPAVARNARVSEMCALTALDGLEDRYPHELSGGQQQRVALARALAASPSILLLDEPLSALDATIRTQLRVEIRRIVRDLGVSALYVTHDQEEALSVADEVAVMRDGRLLQAAPPAEIYLRPADPFVAGFIGAANLLDCRLAGAGVALGELHLPVRRVVAPGAAANEGAAARLVVRPEHVETGVAGTPGYAAARLKGAAFLGPVMRLTLDTAVGQVTVDAPAAEWLSDRPAEGTALGWRPRAALATVFVGFGD